MTEWEVPGYDVVELLGFGTSGEVWSARERASGAAVALRRLAGGDRDAVAAIRASATIVRSLPAEHVIRLRTTTRAGRDDVLVLDHAAGGSLLTLLATRGRFAPGEVVTALAPLAEALGQAHAHGLVHGRVRASSVLLSGAGKPLLDGLGLSCLHDADDTLDPTGGLGAAADVWALGALGHLLLTGSEPGDESLSALAPTAPLPLVRAIEAALGFDPTARPSAGDLAAALLAACPAVPLSGVVAADLPPAAAPRFPVPRAVPRRIVLAGAAALVVLAVIGLGWAWGSRGAPAAATIDARPPAVANDWASILRQLDSARSVAFAHADVAGLTAVYAPSSQLLAADRRALDGLARLRRTAVGVEHVVHSVRAIVAAADRADLEVVEGLAAYDVEGPAGLVVERHPAGPATTHLVTIVRTTSGWRVADIRA